MLLNMVSFLFHCSFGEWSRVGCRTELGENWFIRDEGAPLIVNCTCNHLSTFAVLVDVVDLEVSLLFNCKMFQESKSIQGRSQNYYFE